MTRKIAMPAPDKKVNCFLRCDRQALIRWWLLALIVIDSFVPLFHLGSAGHAHRFNYSTSAFEDVTIHPAEVAAKKSKNEPQTCSVGLPTGKQTFSYCTTSNLAFLAFEIPINAGYSVDAHPFLIHEPDIVELLLFSSKRFRIAPKQSPPFRFVG
jgi:hypothetical protein